MNGDADLLLRYAETSSQADFAKFVARHIHGVYHAALRQLDGDVHRAKDVTQLVFCDVARKARVVAHHPEIVSWLHKSTHYTAANVRRAERSRQKYERAAEAEEALLAENTAPARWERLRPLIDTALLDLNPRDREAVLLRFFENRSFAEIGAALAIGESGARMRVERALDKLHAVLATRGLTSTAAALAAVLGAQGVATTPAELATSVTAAAVSGTPAGALMSAWYFLSASKIGVSVAAMCVVASAGMVHQTLRTRAADVALLDLRHDEARYASRLAELKASVAAAEQQKTKHERTLENARRTHAATAAQAARQGAAEAEKQRLARALQQFLLDDPELRKLRFEANRLHNLADARLRSGASELLEQQAIRYAKQQELQLAEQREKKDSGPIKPPDGSLLVRSFCVGQFYVDDPLTRQQITELEAVVGAARTSNEISRADSRAFAANQAARFDWDRILASAERILSAKQLRGFRAFALQGKADAMFAAVADAATDEAAP